jgi:hypothetical protein
MIPKNISLGEEELITDPLPIIEPCLAANSNHSLVQAKCSSDASVAYYGDEVGVGAHARKYRTTSCSRSLTALFPDEAAPSPIRSR